MLCHREQTCPRQPENPVAAGCLNLTWERSLTCFGNRRAQGACDRLRPCHPCAKSQDSRASSSIVKRGLLCQSSFGGVIFTKPQDRFPDTPSKGRLAKYRRRHPPGSVYACLASPSIARILRLSSRKAPLGLTSSISAANAATCSSSSSWLPVALRNLVPTM